MPVSKKRIAERLIIDEGFSPNGYYDHLGFLTVGIGKLIDERKKGAGLSKAQALAVAELDIVDCIKYLSNKYDWFDGLSSVRQMIVVEMVFQLGKAGFRKFKKMIKALDRYDYEEASKQMLDSKWAMQTPERAYRHAKSMLSGMENIYYERNKNEKRKS